MLVVIVLLVCCQAAHSVFVVGVPIGVEIRLVGFAEQNREKVLQSHLDSLSSSLPMPTTLKWVRPRISYTVVRFQVATNFTEAHSCVQTPQQVDEVFSTIPSLASTFIIYVSLLKHDLRNTETCEVGPISLSLAHRFAVIHLTPNEFKLFGGSGGGVYFDPEYDLPIPQSPWFAPRLASLCHRIALHLILPSPEPQQHSHSHVAALLETPAIILTLMTADPLFDQVVARLQWEKQVVAKLHAYKLDRVDLRLVDKCAVCPQVVGSMERGDWSSASKLVLQSTSKLETNVFNIIVVLARDGLTTNSVVHLGSSLVIAAVASQSSPTTTIGLLCGANHSPIMQDAFTHASTEIVEQALRGIFHMRPIYERIDAGNSVVVDYLFVFKQPHATSSSSKAAQDTAQRNPILLHLDQSLERLRLVPKPSKNAPAVLLAQFHNARIEAKRAGMLIGMFNHEQAKAFALAFRRSVATMESTSFTFQEAECDDDDKTNVFPIIVLLLVTGMLALVYEAKVAKLAQSNASFRIVTTATTTATITSAVPRRDFFTPTQKRD